MHLTVSEVWRAFPAGDGGHTLGRAGTLHLYNLYKGELQQDVFYNQSKWRSINLPDLTALWGTLKFYSICKKK